MSWNKISEQTWFEFVGEGYDLFLMMFYFYRAKGCSGSFHEVFSGGPRRIVKEVLVAFFDFHYCSYQSLHVFTHIAYIQICSTYCVILSPFIYSYGVLFVRSLSKEEQLQYAYESPAQRSQFSYSFMPGKYVEGRPVLGLGFWAHFPVGWAWDLRQVALKQIGWNMTDGRNINNHEGIVWKWRDLNEDGWKPRVCPLWLLWVGPVETDVETPELKAES